MKYHLFILCAFLTGCSTSVVTGKKKLLGLLPVPFTGSNTPHELTDRQLMIAQMAPFQYVALVLIVGGVALWWLTSGKTGAGKLCVALGLGLSTFALVMPQIAGWIGLVAVICLIGLIVYLVASFFFDRAAVNNAVNKIDKPAEPPD